MKFLYRVWVALVEFWWWVVSLFKPSYSLLDIFIKMLGDSLEKRGVSYEIGVRRKSKEVFTVAIKIIHYQQHGRRESKLQRVFQLEFKNGKTKEKQQAVEYCKGYIDIFLKNLQAYFSSQGFMSQGAER